MHNRIALITGGNGGLGSAVTQAFLDAGATVMGVSRKIAQAEFNSPRFHAFSADLSSRAAAAKIVDDVVKQFGRLDVLVHTVGAFAGGTAVADTGDATWQRMFELNVNSAFHVVRAVLPHMRQAGFGRIIGMGSRAAVEPGPNLVAYNASKAAFVSLFRTIALENKDSGVTANVLLPGTMDTAANRRDMPNADFSKWVKPADVAQLILYLAGDPAGDINGAAIPIYGRA